jgi:serine/threonine-protein kinase HipA
MIISVKLYGEELGFLQWDSMKGNSIFQYSEAAINRGLQPSPIVMPLEQRVFETNRNHLNFHNLPYMIADSMPDDFGNAMMKAWLQQRNLSIENINPVERLTYLGKRGMGALEYEPIRHSMDKAFDVNVEDLFNVTQRVLQSKKSILYRDLDKDALTDMLRIGTSVGGARAKALIALKFNKQGDIISIRPGDINQPKGYGYWLLKIDGANQASLGESEGLSKIEYAYYLMAKAASINMAESFLFEENNRFHFLTKRFDKDAEGNKIHMQTWGAITGIDFRIPKASSYEVLFRTMKRLHIGYDQFVQQYRRMLFNVIARNHDDHVKNFSFIMGADGIWSISPAYDLTYAYSPKGTWTNVHQSSIRAKYDDFSKKDLIDFAIFFGIKNAKLIIQEVEESIAHWNIIAREIEIPESRIKFIQKNFRKLQ